MGGGGGVLRGGGGFWAAPVPFLAVRGGGGAGAGEKKTRAGGGGGAGGTGGGRAGWGGFFSAGFGFWAPPVPCLALRGGGVTRAQEKKPPAARGCGFGVFSSWMELWTRRGGMAPVASGALLGV